MQELQTNIEHSNAQSNRWFASIQGLPGVEMKLVHFTLPSMSVDNTNIKHEGDNMISIPGDVINIDPISLNFIIDSRYRNFFFAYKWMRGNARSNTPDVRDVTVMLLDNQGSPQGTQIIYKDCFISSLSQLDLDNIGEDNDLIANMVLVTNDIEINILDSDNITQLRYPEDKF